MEERRVWHRIVEKRSVRRGTEEKGLLPSESREDCEEEKRGECCWKRGTDGCWGDDESAVWID